MEARKDYIGEERVETVYFGGGTPSLLETEELTLLLDSLRHRFNLAPGAEITLEANPDDVTGTTRLQGWQKAGINRLSIGVQSFFGEDLQWMNRAHDARQAMECIRMAQEEGFGNISIDLIYGGPTLPDNHWRENVERAIGMGIPHLSCYALTVEPRTALDTLIRRHQMTDVSPEDQARQFLLLMDWTAAAGYEHYEISNFSLPGHRSRHNSAYWQGKKYLGLGPSAHSYNGVSREWNVANNARYITAMMAKEGGGSAGHGPGSAGLTVEKEILTPVQQVNEYIMISLRTLEGIDLSTLAQRFGAEKAATVQEKATRYILEGRIRLTADALRLTKEGKLLADGIAADLFFD